MARRKTGWTALREEISVTVGGVTHRGAFQTERGTIRVFYRGSTRAMRLASSKAAPATLARLILHELVREAPAD
jgi:hypothetical protein